MTCFKNMAKVVSLLNLEFLLLIVYYSNTSMISGAFKIDKKSDTEGVLVK